MYKVAFLDRDGVLNKSNINNGYIGYKKDFKWIPGSIKAIEFIKSKGFKIVVVTNQSGVARGFFKYRDVQKLHKYMQKELKKNKTKIDKILFCPFHIDGIVKKYKLRSKLRKPDIGMYKLIEKKWKIDRGKSFMIGDQTSDMKFAKKAKIKGFLFRKGNLYKFIKNKI